MGRAVVATRPRPASRAVQSVPTPSTSVLVAVAVVAAASLVVDPFALRPFDFVKTFVGVAGVLGAVWFVARSDRLTLPFAPVWAVLCGWLVVATVVGVTWPTGLFGGPGRDLGVLMWLVFAMAMAVGATVARRCAVGSLVDLIVLVSIPVVAYALVQASGVDPVDATGVDADRARSLLGNAAYLGTYLVVVVPLAMARAVATDDWRRPVMGVAAAGGAVALLASQTRGAWVGALVGVVAVAIAHRRRISRSPRGVTMGLAGAVAIVALIAVTPLGSRAASIVDPATGTAYGRLLLWESAMDLVADSPLLGRGAESFRVVAPATFDQRHVDAVGTDVVPDRAHNAVLDVAVAGGIPAALAYLVLLGMVLAAAWRGATRDPLGAGLLAAIIGWIVAGQFAFPIGWLDLTPWLLAGAAVTRAGPAAAWSVEVPRRAARIAAAVVALPILIWASTGLIGDHAARDASIALAEGRADDAVSAADAAALHGSWHPEFLQVASRTAAAAAGVAAPSNVEGLIDKTVDTARAASARMNGDPAFALDVARALTLRASSGRDDWEPAVDAFRAVTDAAPVDPRGFLGLGAASTAAGDLDLAIDSFRRVTVLTPDDPLGWRNLGLLLADRGDPAARAALERALLLDPDDDRVRTTLESLDTATG